MRLRYSAPCMLLALAAAYAAGARGTADPVRVEPLLRTATTSSGAPIMLPRGQAEATASRYHIAAHASLPAHQHPYPRFGYVLAGSLIVTNVETGQSRRFVAGEVIIEDVGTWHAARNLAAEPVELFVLDLAPPATNNVVRKD
jgi:quercetin dioxygenase-like cupin family protein